MTASDLRALLEEMAGGPAPPNAAGAEQVYAAGRRRHRRRQRRMVAAVTAALTVGAALGGAAVVTVLPQRGGVPADRGASSTPGDPRPGMTGPGAIIQWAGAADATHLYLRYLSCPASPCDKDSFDLVGSDDSGRTWTARATGVAASRWSVLGPDTLVASGNGAGAHPIISVDGGRTWSDLRRETAATAAVPTGGVAVCWTSDDDGSPCRLYAVDPPARRFVPLAVPPPLVLSPESEVQDVGGELWVAGTDSAAGRPAVAVSTDRGRQWSTHVFTELVGCTPSRCGAPELSTADGETVYAMVLDSAASQRAVYRRGGGGGWQRLDTGNIPFAYAADWSFVTSAGRHVLCELDRRDQEVGCRFWAAPAGGGQYQRVELDGLPNIVRRIERSVDGWYYTASSGPESVLYGSTDGWHWTTVTSR